MKLGSENKKAVYALAVLGAVALYFVYTGFLAGPSSPTSSEGTSTPAVAAAPPAATASGSEAETSGAPRAPARTQEFKPKLHPRSLEERIDPTRVDPTLRLDLLTKLQEVPAPSGSHNLFQIGPSPVKVEMPKGPETVVASMWGPKPLPPPPPPFQPVKKQPVPVNVKYYGWAAPSGSERRKAFFLDPDGDNMIVKMEGETLKGHYRVVRIGPTTVVLEDTNDKLQQTLNKAEDASV
jgi:hypothetical protein